MKKFAKLLLHMVDLEEVCEGAPDMVKLHPKF